MDMLLLTLREGLSIILEENRELEEEERASVDKSADVYEVLQSK